MRTLSTILWLKIRRKKKKNIGMTGLLEYQVSYFSYFKLFHLDMHRTSTCLHFIFVSVEIYHNNTDKKGTGIRKRKFAAFESILEFLECEAFLANFERSIFTHLRGIFQLILQCSVF